jgi:restriction endonuclease
VARTNIFSESGARLRVMSLDKFQQTHETVEVRVGKFQTLKEMWRRLNRKKEWNVQRYDSVKHNCQHFVVAVMKALKNTGAEQHQHSVLPPLVNAQLKAK